MIPRWPRAGIFVGGVALLLLPGAISAQASGPVLWPAPGWAMDGTPVPAESPVRWPSGTPAVTGARAGAPAAGPSWLPVAASAVLPGTGQLLQERRRGWVYLGVEALVWLGYASERGRGRDDRGAYRDLAWEVARGGTGPRADGSFEYYERMSRWTRSGSFDRDPGTPGVQPEEDPATFNGDAWRLAAAIFLGGGPADPQAPGYEAALGYYQDRAYPDAFLWDWTGEAASLDRYRDLIEESDTHFRNASLILGGAVVNRLASTLDAVLTRRTGLQASLRMTPALAPGRNLHSRITLRVVLP